MVVVVSNGMAPPGHFFADTSEKEHGAPQTDRTRGNRWKQRPAGQPRAYYGSPRGWSPFPAGWAAARRRPRRLFPLRIRKAFCARKDLARALAEMPAKASRMFPRWSFSATFWGEYWLSLNSPQKVDENDHRGNIRAAFADISAKVRARSLRAQKACRILSGNSRRGRRRKTAPPAGNGDRPRGLP